jgi:hypothetical protein
MASRSSSRRIQERTRQVQLLLLRALLMQPQGRGAAENYGYFKIEEVANRYDRKQKETGMENLIQILLGILVGGFSGRFGRRCCNASNWNSKSAGL